MIFPLAPKPFFTQEDLLDYLRYQEAKYEARYSASFDWTKEEDPEGEEHERLKFLYRMYRDFRTLIENE